MDNTTVVTTVPADGFREGMVQTATAKEDNPGRMVAVHVTQERIENIKAGVIRRVMKQDYDALFAFVATFMVNADGSYMDKEAAFEILDELTLAQLAETSQEIIRAAQEQAAPKV